MKLVQGSCELRRGEKVIFLVISFSAYFKCSVEWRGENLTLIRHSLAVVNHESGFEILRSKVKLVFDIWMARFLIRSICSYRISKLQKCATFHSHWNDLQAHPCQKSLFFHFQLFNFEINMTVLLSFSTFLLLGTFELPVFSNQTSHPFGQGMRTCLNPMASRTTNCGFRRPLPRLVMFDLKP